ncbi:MAG: cytochrome D1 domain-containing protein [Sulfuricurvum sp.]|nr:cytochrome D1 domain-containing protein [Sulfuricurvum sp.]MDD5386140.1 cytochrome D1 domain-containing protein [Sulfuricurvum sp.]
MKKVLGITLAGAVFATLPLMAGESKMDVAKMFEKECQGCHGPNHEGGVGSSLDPKVISKKNAYLLVDTIMGGRAGTAMPSFKDKMNKDDADKMVDYLLKYQGQQIKNLTIEDVAATHQVLQDRDALYKKYPKPADVKSVQDIVIFTERDASKVGFIDGTTNKVLSKHDSGFATHVTVVNKRIPRYVYNISRDGWVNMFDLNAPGQPIIAKIRVGSDSRGLACTPDGKYVMAGNYVPGGAILLDAMTLKPLKVYPTSSVIDMDGNLGTSRVASIADTPYGPYIAFALKDAGHVYIVDYSKPDFPIVGDIPGIGKILHDAFLNEGEEIGRYYMIASQGSDVVGIVDFKTKTLAGKVYTGPGSKPHPGQGSSWYSEKLAKQLHATVNMNLGQTTIWDNKWNVVKQVNTEGGGLFVGTNEKTPFVWADNVIGGESNYNKINLINKETLMVDRIIEADIDGTIKLINPDTHKVIKEWSAGVVKNAKGEAIIPRLLHAEPSDHGEHMYVSDWTGGRILVFNSKTGEYITKIEGLTTPTFTYSIEHRMEIPGA